jgi:predicted  nucleic acid-binding Zn-ribbon protein
MLALILLVPYVFFVAYLVLKAPPTPTLETLGATYGSLAAAVVGYYFGQKPVQDALNKAQEATTQQQKLKGNLVNVLSELGDVQQQLASHKSTIQEIHHGNVRFHEESRKLPQREDTRTLIDLAKPEILESQKNKVDADVLQVDSAVKKLDDLRRNSLRLLE